MDDMSLNLDKPQEDEFAMAALTGHSTLTNLIFPRSGALDLDYLSLRDLDTTARKWWVANWVFFLKSVLLRAGQTKRLVLKSPQHTARIKLILSVFPRAKFIHIARNPTALFSSTKRTWQAMAEQHGLQSNRYMRDWLDENIVTVMDHMYACYEEDRQLLEPDQLYETTYEELVANPHGVLTEAYSALGLGAYPKVDVEAKVLESQGYQARTTQQVLAKDIDKSAPQWARYRRLFGYIQSVN